MVKTRARAEECCHFDVLLLLLVAWRTCDITGCPHHSRGHICIFDYYYYYIFYALIYSTSSPIAYQHLPFSSSFRRSTKNVEVQSDGALRRESIVHSTWTPYAATFGDIMKNEKVDDASKWCWAEDTYESKRNLHLKFAQFVHTHTHTDADKCHNRPKWYHEFSNTYVQLLLDRVTG